MISYILADFTGYVALLCLLSFLGLVLFCMGWLFIRGLIKASEVVDQKPPQRDLSLNDEIEQTLENNDE